MERIHQIVTLKRAGFTLEAIGHVLARSNHDFAGIIEAQLAAVSEQVARLGEMRALLLNVKARLARHELLDPKTLCALIHDSQQALTDETEAWQNLYREYMDEAAQQDFARTMPAMVCEYDSAEYNEKWRELGERIKAAMPLAPDAPEALGFVREWMTLLAPFSAIATPAMWESTRAMYDDVDTWRGQEGIDPGFDGAVWRFIRAATEAALTQGEDIGPVPEWFGPRVSKEG